jgi:hypothetical protein
MQALASAAGDAALRPLTGFGRTCHRSRVRTRLLSNPEQLFKTLGQLRTTWPKAGWSWDNRLLCVASSFSTELTAEAHAVAARALSHEWTMRNISAAPQLLRDVAESTGGIRADQLLLSTDPHGRVVAYGLWWPWGDDATISLRVGLTGFVSDSDLSRFKELFGIQD